jgi:hypothetical protein
MACYLEVVRVYDIASASHVVLGKAIIIHPRRRIVYGAIRCHEPSIAMAPRPWPVAQSS